MKVAAAEGKNNRRTFRWSEGFLATAWAVVVVVAVVVIVVKRTWPEGGDRIGDKFLVLSVFMVCGLAVVIAYQITDCTRSAAECYASHLESA